MREAIRLIIIQAFCNQAAIAHGYGYALLSILPGMAEPERATMIRWLQWTSIGSTLLVTPILIAMLLPVATALARKGNLSAERLQGARRRALNLPVLMTRLTNWAWYGAAFSLPIYLHLAGREMPFVTTAHVMAVTMLIGSVASTFVFYLAERSLRTRVVPRLLPDGGVFAVPGVIVTSLGFKILMLLVLVCVLPVVVLTLAAWSGAVRPAAVFYVGISFVVFGAIQGWLITRSIAAPVRTLVREMKRVRDEDFTAQAPVVSPDELGQLADGFNRMTAGLRQAEFVKDTFGRYVTSQVRDEILGGKIHLGGERREVTVLFSDIRGFTAFSERQSPEDTVAFLNAYLERMVTIIVEEGGTVDKFIGDAILASFGVPLAREDDPLRAVRAAQRMLAAVDDMNAHAGGTAVPLQIGIGIHSGPVVVGNIGSARKMEYTIIGDTVNTASRIEQLTKELGASLLISEETWRRVAADVQAEPLAPVAVKGKREKLQLYAVAGMALRPEPSRIL